MISIKKVTMCFQFTVKSFLCVGHLNFMGKAILEFKIPAKFFPSVSFRMSEDTNIVSHIFYNSE